MWREQDDIWQSNQIRVYRGFALKHVETCAGELAALDGASEGGFINDFAARSVDDKCVRLSSGRGGANLTNEMLLAYADN